MKTTTTLLLLALACAASAQQTLPAAPAPDVHLHLEAATQLRKAAWHQETSIYWLVGGGLLTMLSADRSVPRYDHALAVGMASLTSAGFVVFQIKGARHTRAASSALRQ